MVLIVKRICYYFLLSTLFTIALSLTSGHGQSVYDFVNVQYNWPNDSMKQAFISSGRYINENNIISGIKLYKDAVFVTVPRWRNGIPATLNKLVKRTGTSEIVLEPFPSWRFNTIGDCESFQYVQSMEVDPNTGWMWIIDTGRINTSPQDGTSPVNGCPPKLVVFDVGKSQVVRRYTFPGSVASSTSNFLNDIVLDYVNGKARFAYITDSSDAKLDVYDFEVNTSYSFQHSSMLPEVKRGQSGHLTSGIPINGIAMSPDFKYVYYCPLSGRSLFRISTKVLRKRNGDFSTNFEKVLTKEGQTGGIVAGRNGSIYYGVLEKNAVYKFDIEHNRTYELTVNNSTLKWPDTFAFKGKYLWFVANDLGSFLANSMVFNGTVANMHVWKVFVGEEGYLADASRRTSLSPSTIG